MARLGLRHGIIVGPRRDKELPVNVIQKGYGEVKLDGGDVLTGEIILYAEGWVAVSAVQGTEEGIRWFPKERVAEVAWKKSVAVRRPS
jgi:hypothetical protein